MQLIKEIFVEDGTNYAFSCNGVPEQTTCVNGFIEATVGANIQDVILKQDWLEFFVIENPNRDKSSIRIKLMFIDSFPIGVNEMYIKTIPYLDGNIHIIQVLN